MRELLRGELSRRAAALLIGQHVDNQRLQLLVRRFPRPLCLRQAGALVAPPVPPPQDSLRIDTKCCRLLDRRFPAGRPQHYLDALRQSALDGPLSV